MFGCPDTTMQKPCLTTGIYAPFTRSAWLPTGLNYMAAMALSQRNYFLLGCHRYDQSAIGVILEKMFPWPFQFEYQTDENRDMNRILDIDRQPTPNKTVCVRDPNTHISVILEKMFPKPLQFEYQTAENRDMNRILDIDRLATPNKTVCVRDNTSVRYIDNVMPGLSSLTPHA